MSNTASSTAKEDKINKVFDIYARLKRSTGYRVYQCKREKSFGPAKIRAAVSKFLEGETSRLRPSPSIAYRCLSNSVISRLS